MSDRTDTPGRAPDCTTSRAATIAGILAEAVMAGEMTLFQKELPVSVGKRIEATIADPRTMDLDAFMADVAESARVAHLMIEARARASVRTPDAAALSAAEVALALAEDCLNWIPVDDEAETPDAFATLASIADVLRAGLARRHAAERAAPDAQAPYDAGPPRAVATDGGVA